jgi:hypothetical protein
MRGGALFSSEFHTNGELCAAGDARILGRVILLIDDLREILTWV